jgi:hypothetical protein
VPYAPNYDSPDYQLSWPKEVFLGEAQTLLGYTGPGWTDRARLLLEEAFAGQGPAEDLNTASWQDLPAALNSWGSGNGGEDAQRRAVAVLVRDVALFREATRPRPYYAARQGRDLKNVPDLTETSGLPLLRRSWPALVEQFRNSGYLANVAPDPCVDDSDPPPPVDVALRDAIQERTGIAGLWPMRLEEWDDDLLLTMIEVVHDLVARPRARSWHDYGRCGWHYSSFALAPGQQLYRARTNRLLATVGIGLTLAELGEDTGRLVTTPTDDRAELVRRSLSTPKPADRRTVEHAVALFRSRGATVEERRSAAFNLASLLEERRVLLKTELLSKDEGALFQIANQFAVRHRNAAQQDDYDPVFLEWIFWLFLATVELTDRLLARADSPRTH